MPSIGHDAVSPHPSVCGLSGDSALTSSRPSATPPKRGYADSRPLQNGRVLRGLGTGNVPRFLACRRGVSALETVLVIIPIILSGLGLFEIAHTAFMADLVQRAAYQIVHRSTLERTAASTAETLRTDAEQWLSGEVGGLLNFESSDENGQCSTNANFCVTVTFFAYRDPSAMLRNNALGRSDRGGKTGDMIVVEVVAVPQFALSKWRARIMGDLNPSLKGVAVWRNEQRGWS